MRARCVDAIFGEVVCSSLVRRGPDLAFPLFSHTELDVHMCGCACVILEIARKNMVEQLTSNSSSNSSSSAGAIYRTIPL